MISSDQPYSTKDAQDSCSYIPRITKETTDMIHRTAICKEEPRMH